MPPARPLHIIGLMSGTSADSIDAALCRVSGAPPRLQAEIVAAVDWPYPPQWQAHIHQQADRERARVDALAQLHFALGECFAQAADAVIAAAGMQPTAVDLIAMHGQTVWHHVRPDGVVTATLQIGEPAVVAERTGITTLSNFRARDVAAGGQGAPLTSYVDWLLLRHPHHWRAVQNIGGIGNVTLLPPLDDPDSAPLSFDTGPGNVWMDGAIALLTDGALRFDRDGAWAAQGQVDEGLLEDLLQRDAAFYAQPPPKTTGRERYHPAALAGIVQAARAAGLAEADVLATLTMLTAVTIRDACRQFAPVMPAEILIGGGGARNPALLAALGGLLPEVRLLTHEALGLSSDFKEALVFAVLGHESWFNRPAALPAFTGARHPSVLGSITPGANYRRLLRAAPPEENDD